MTRARARQWSRTAFALAALFATFPVAGRLLLGEWAFEEATGVAGLFLAAGIYLHIRARRMRTAPDAAMLLDAAIRMVEAGDLERASRILDRAIAENPKFWQAFQCRAEVRLRGGDVAAAIEDFDQAIAIAPREPHLYELRAYAARVAEESGERE